MFMNKVQQTSRVCVLGQDKLILCLFLKQLLFIYEALKKQVSLSTVSSASTFQN